MIRATQFSTMWATHEIQLGTGHDHLFCARLRVVSCLWFNFKFQLIWRHSANSFFTVIQFQWKFHFPMIKIPLNWSLPISAHHITQGIVVACAVLCGTAINPNVYDADHRKWGQQRYTTVKFQTCPKHQKHSLCPRIRVSTHVSFVILWRCFINMV